MNKMSMPSVSEQGVWESFKNYSSSKAHALRDFFFNASSLRGNRSQEVEGRTHFSFDRYSWILASARGRVWQGPFNDSYIPGQVSNRLYSSLEEAKEKCKSELHLRCSGITQHPTDGRWMLRGPSGQLQQSPEHEVSWLAPRAENAGKVCVPYGDITSPPASESAWVGQVAWKHGSCLNLKHGAIWLFHARKAAGTTLRKFFEGIASDHKVPFWETEGKTIEDQFLMLPGVFTVTSIRHPVQRIFSLYWYEHVGWWDGIAKDHSKMRTMNNWIDEWRDGSEWKRKYMTRFPGNVYVEIENYFVKLFCGWKGPAPVTEKDLERAKVVLSNFDLVFPMDEIEKPEAFRMVTTIFDVRNETFKKENKVEPKIEAAKQKLKHLVADKDAITSRLLEMNALDMKLFEFAQNLYKTRLSTILSTERSIFHTAMDQQPAECCQASMPGGNLKRELGIHQTPTHKH